MLTMRSMAEREWERLPDDVVPYFRELFQQLAAHLQDPRAASTLRWKKIERGGRAYGVSNLWSVRASRKHRVLLTRTPGGGVEIIGFRSRGDKDCYQ